MPKAGTTCWGDTPWMKLLHFPALAALLLAGCASMKPSDFANDWPALDPMTFFSGHTRSTGVLENRAGAPLERVVTETHGRWADGALRLDQKLIIGTGKPRYRFWKIRRLDAHHYEATANDIVGVVRGEAYGDVFHWSFTLALSPGDPLANVRLSQWMYLEPGGETLVNHSTIRKAGIILAQVTEQFRREAGSEPGSPRRPERRVTSPEN